MKIFDLEQRTLNYAINIRNYTKSIPKSIENIEYAKQIIRSSSSIGANYIEANESLSKKDFKYRIKISLKETKETRYWLRLIDDSREINKYLVGEATELIKIFSAIINKN